MPPEESAEVTSSVFDTGSTVESIGCTNSNYYNNLATDGTTDKYRCDKSRDTTGIVVKPAHKRMSIVKKLRVYSHNNCPNW